MSGSDVEAGLWLRRFHQADAGAPGLICFPPAGGSASWFHPMSAALAPDVDVVAMQYPGRQDRRAEDPIDDVVVLAYRISRILSGATGWPVAFFGHSVGATVAFEVARALVAADGAGPAHLLVSGRRAPTRHRDEHVHRRDDAGILQDLRRLGGTDARVLGDDDVIRLVLPATRADYRAAETYRYVAGPLLTCPVTALTGDDDPSTTLDEAAGWREVTTGAFELRVFPGGHFFLTRHLDEIVRLIGERLGTAA